ncbi:hypothetical protein TREMEDRAFT_35623 [Tremella mesenterica DSM 1558]|uniref:uncharacterized protein n=1 Tax=Tremella mesenterica (strain ATCC 24925 / CBS 8224 / DSM 1558 / NBRC 9311 / NRRL Y-6157 / RJB 2259-6 / UBC 559-6) TaxID=578456 RepID=UPI00032C1F76|nr:uncharacterized protein TREMEDRAFT_35623 [Tremella mesenterica DSM 1558]EIW66062.1 hypothetical protein TREMEDRAFT_35623 [Tremella mesenterica DSM 1558]
MEYAYALIDRGYVPDMVLRPVIRKLCRNRQREIDHGHLEANHAAKLSFISDLYHQPIAVHQDKANEQHYEIPTSFLRLCLGPRMKYSSCFWPTPTCSLVDAEDAILSLYCQEARLGLEGLKILDMGCGWGSLGLFLAEHYPLAEITMLSNSRTQKEYIDSIITDKGYEKVEVITGDVATYEFSPSQFTHILSIELLEHLRSYPLLFTKISTWLQPHGILYIHIFCHRTQPYLFLQKDGWMAQTFFTGGCMPSFDLFLYFQKQFTILDSKWMNGRQYSRTLEAWLKNQDKFQKDGLEILRKEMGCEEGEKTFWRFRVFFMACSEFFGMDQGETWGVGRYLFEKK